MAVSAVADGRYIERNALPDAHPAVRLLLQTTSRLSTSSSTNKTSLPSPKMAPPTLYLNIPTSNPEASLEFFTALGFEPVPEYSDTDTKAFRLPAPNSTVCVMSHSHKRFKEFMRPGTEVSDATKTTEVLISLSAEKKEDVDVCIAKAVAAGGSADPFTMPEYGAECGMYSRSFADLDGHIWEVVAMLAGGLGCGGSAEKKE